jgi:hypothetical protein
MSSRRFTRMVVGLPQGMGNASAMQAAADLAEYLQIELLAAFIADAALLNLAGFPAMRELRILDQQWQPLELARIAGELEDAAEVARKRFDDSVGSRALKASFDVLRSADVIPSLIQAGDILTIIEPSHPGESITWQFTALMDAALEAAAAILFVPRRIAHTSGPIMALADGPQDPTIRAALEVAAALKENLIVVAPPGAPLSAETMAEAKQRGVAVQELVANASGADATLLPASSRAGERLRVIARQLLGDGQRLFSMLYGVPLLMINSDQTATPGQMPDALEPSSA